LFDEQFNPEASIHDHPVETNRNYSSVAQLISLAWRGYVQGRPHKQIRVGQAPVSDEP
jgi:hypothetical protein